MLSDRSYMREDYQRERTSVLIWLISAIAAGFILQLLVDGPWFRDGYGSETIRAVALSVPAVKSGWVWTLLTHSFLHNPHYLFHVAGNLFVLYLLGRELLPMLGSRRFLGLYAAATVVGGLAWLAVHWRFGGTQMHMGATAAVDALFVVFACFFPNQELNFLLLFLFPVTLKPKYIAGALVVFDLVGLIFAEIPGATFPLGIGLASSAHLGGMLTGFVYYRFVYDAHWFGRGDRAAELELPRWLKRTKKPRLVSPTPELPAPATPEEIRARVDRILDKINSQGLGALTAEEKRLLDNARALLSRH
jgi:membrane associated rhomboid family serine protease